MLKVTTQSYFKFRAGLCTCVSLVLLLACSLNQDKVKTIEADGLSFKSEVKSKALRSVIDGKPRMLTIALTNDIKASYDTQNASLYKIWQGEINLTGAVFDGRHGPQPSSQGQLFLHNPNANWQLSQNASVEYVGYVSEPKSGDITIEYLVKGDSWKASLSERIEQDLTNNEFRIKRLFDVSDLPKSVVLKLETAAINSSSRTNDMNLIERSGQQYSILLKNGTTAVSTVFDALDTSPSLAKEDDSHPGLVAIKQSDCSICHNPLVKTVGPSYQEIAARYVPKTQNNNDALETIKLELGKRIIEGGKDNWGPIAMTPHPNLSYQDTDTMLDYIFTYAPEQTAPAASQTDLFLGLGPVHVDFSDQQINHTEDVSGAYMYMAKIPSGDEPSLHSIMNTPPILGALASQIHLPSADAFAPYNENIAIRVKTNLVLTENLQTTLRLVSDDGSLLMLNGDQVIDNWGFHGPQAVDAKVSLKAGSHPIEIVFMQGLGGAALSLQWLNPETQLFELVPSNMLTVTQEDVMPISHFVPDAVRAIPGDKQEVAGVHPAFDLQQARPVGFEPMVGGIDFLSDGRMVVSTWDSQGAVYLIENYMGPQQNIEVTQIAKGLAEPLGIKVVDDEIYVLQKQELTRLVDTNNDGLIERYEVVSNKWGVSANFHEFAFGLEYKDGYFYAALATAIEPGGASTQPQVPDRGKALKISKKDGSIEFVAHGLRTPNGIGFGVDDDLFIADNQGDWLPASKIVELTQNAFYGSRSVDKAGTENTPETLPVVWLPQNEIGNSPSQPAPLNVGPYQNQMIHGEVTHGGLKRVFAERVNGRLQGAVFRFSQGFEAGVNRIAWANPNTLIVGGIGNPGNWSHAQKAWYGLQSLTYNGNRVFEMLSVSARTNGFEVTFTEAIKEGQQISPDDFEIIQWRYQPTEAYGGPKLDEEVLKVAEFSLSNDRTRVQFVLPNIKPNHLVYFRIKQPFVSESNAELWTTEAWYTLNNIPQQKPVKVNPQYKLVQNQLSEAERELGWLLLFDGQSLQGIRNYNSESLGKRWVIDDQAIHLSGKLATEDGWQTNQGGDIVITPEPIQNFELYLEWKIQAGGNSGIMYNVKESPELAYPFLSGPEMQILDNQGHPDGKIVTHRAGDNYDLMASKIVTVNPPGSWNRVRLIVNNGHVEHWLNGYKVVDLEMFTPQWEALIANSKFSDWPAFGKSKSGHIVLQDHGDRVWFRNLKLLKL